MMAPLKALLGLFNSDEIHIEIETKFIPNLDAAVEFAYEEYPRYNQDEHQVHFHDTSGICGEDTWALSRAMWAEKHYFSPIDADTRLPTFLAHFVPKSSVEVTSGRVKIAERTQVPAADDLASVEDDTRQPERPPQHGNQKQQRLRPEKGFYKAHRHQCSSNQCSDNGCDNKNSWTECDDLICSKGSKCANRELQRGLGASKITEVGASPIHGKGLFASSDIVAQHKIVEYTGSRTPRSRVNSLTSWHFAVGKDLIDGASRSNLGRWVNHSCNPNCIWEPWEVAKVIRPVLVAKCSIRKGDELTARLDGFLKAGECRCGSPKCSQPYREESITGKEVKLDGLCVENTLSHALPQLISSPLSHTESSSPDTFYSALSQDGADGLKDTRPTKKAQRSKRARSSQDNDIELGEDSPSTVQVNKKRPKRCLDTKAASIRVPVSGKTYVRHSEADTAQARSPLDHNGCIVVRIRERVNIRPAYSGKGLGLFVEVTIEAGQVIGRLTVTQSSSSALPIARRVAPKKSNAWWEEHPGKPSILRARREIAAHEEVLVSSLPKDIKRYPTNLRLCTRMNGRLFCIGDQADVLTSRGNKNDKQETLEIVGFGRFPLLFGQFFLDQRSIPPQLRYRTSCPKYGSNWMQAFECGEAQTLPVPRFTPVKYFCSIQNALVDKRDLKYDGNAGFITAVDEIRQFRAKRSKKSRE